MWREAPSWAEEVDDDDDGSGEAATSAMVAAAWRGVIEIEPLRLMWTPLPGKREIIITLLKYNEISDVLSHIIP